MPGDRHPVTLLVPSTSAEPMEVHIEGYGLRMVVVNRESIGLLEGSWDNRGVYMLLGRGQQPELYTAYVGKATGQGLRSRVREHVRAEKEWDRALLITSDQGFDSAAIGWLEGRFYDVLTNAAAAVVLNRVQPRDDTIPDYRREMLERYVEPVMVVLRALGASPDTSDQKPTQPARPRRQTYTESVSDLIAAGLLKAGTRLRPVRRNLDEPATVLEDGSVEVKGQVFNALSPAAEAVSGNKSEPGWEFWGAPSADGTLVRLFDLRERLRAQGVPSVAPATPTPTAPKRTNYAVTLEQLVQAGHLEAGETLVALRKRVGSVEAVLHADGTIEVAGERYKSPSAAAVAVSGTSSEPGWEYWAVRRDGDEVSLFQVRRRYLDEQS